jgi:hypothetical protein
MRADPPSFVMAGCSRLKATTRSRAGQDVRRCYKQGLASVHAASVTSLFCTDVSQSHGESVIAVDERNVEI